jgi:hypothetical protein
MPTILLRGYTPTDVPAYAVIGQYGDPYQGDFVTHVAVLREKSCLSFGDPAEVWHMGPPLVVGVQSLRSARGRDRCAAHVAGHAEPLSDHDKERIETFLAEVDKEDCDSGRYVVSPAVKEVRAPDSGILLYRRFSCAGLVLACYSKIGIDLVEENDHLPPVYLDTLAQVYGDRVRDESYREKRDLGIPGGGPWPILLPGYLLHSLQRATPEIRNRAHQPAVPANQPAVPPDAFFPGAAG